MTRLNDTPLLDWTPIYPVSPGYKATGTSQAAAAAMQPAAGTLRAACLQTLTTYGAQTADEIAREIRETPFAVRPRLTELQRLGLVRDSGERRANASGRSAIVWEPAAPAGAERDSASEVS